MVCGQIDSQLDKDTSHNIPKHNFKWTRALRVQNKMMQNLEETMNLSITSV